MPYITKKRLDALLGNSTSDFNYKMTSKGELNFMITQLLIEYINDRKLSYTTISEASAAARDAANELDRRILSKYEDTMLQKHGDVYQSLLTRFQEVK